MSLIYDLTKAQTTQKFRVEVDSSKLVISSEQTDLSSVRLNGNPLSITSTWNAPNSAGKIIVTTVNKDTYTLSSVGNNIKMLAWVSRKEIFSSHVLSLAPIKYGKMNL